MLKGCLACLVILYKSFTACYMLITGGKVKNISDEKESLICPQRVDPAIMNYYGKN